MTISQASQAERPDIAVIAVHNDAFRKLVCLGTPPRHRHSRPDACHTLADGSGGRVHE